MMKLKILAAVAVAGMLSTVLPVQAENGRNAAAIGGLAAGALIGGAIAGGRPGYDGGPRRVYEEEQYAPACHLERQAVVNSWGEVVRYRRVRVCD
jgi:hypothetical protein